MAEKTSNTGDPKKGDKVAASEDEPQFIVETDEGKRAAHKAGTLKKE